MHAFKTLLVVSAIAATLAAPNLRADDTPEAAQLREALRKAEAASSGQQTKSPTSVPATKPAPPSNDNDAALREALHKSQPTSSEQPVANTAPTATFTEAPPANADDEALRKALRDSQAASAGQTVAGTAPTATFSEAPPTGADDEALRKALRQSSASPGTFSEVPAASGNDEALRAALYRSGSEPAAASPATKTMAVTQPAKKTTAKFPTTAFTPLARPESPISATKEQQLAELLRKYKADEITPAEYHKQRAAILGEH